jgi:hypothetical protein
LARLFTERPGWGRLRTGVWNFRCSLPTFAYFYAEAEDGTWWGDNAGPGAYVTDDVFDDCFAIGHSAPWRVVSMAEINVGWPPALPGTHTINLN